MLPGSLCVMELNWNEIKGISQRYRTRQ
jgi:hypothetical protein